MALDIEYLRTIINNRRKFSNKLSNSAHRARKILLILEKYNYKCVKCGATEELTIDHINGRKFAKHDNATKYKLEKCQVLCVTCHMEKNKK